MKLLLVLTALLATACDSSAPSEPITTAELETLLSEAQECSPGDSCAVVDTYCCPRGVNAGRLDEVIDALRAHDNNGEECLADCAGTADQLTATCEDLGDDGQLCFPRLN